MTERQLDRYCVIKIDMSPKKSYIARLDSSNIEFIAALEKAEHLAT